MPGRKGRASNHELHALRENLFVADAVLNRTNCALIVKDVGDLRDCDPSMNRLGRDNAIVAARQILGITSRVQARGKICRSRKSQAILPDSVGVLFPHVVGPHFGLASFREMRGEQAAYSSASDYADLHSD